MHAATAAARRKPATADTPSTAKPRRPSDPQPLDPLAEKLRARALVRNAVVRVAMSAPSVFLSAKEHPDVRGGTRIAVGSHEPFIGEVISNIRPHEQKSRTSTHLNGFATGDPWKRNSEDELSLRDFQATDASHPLIGVSEPVESSSNGAALVTEVMAPLLLTVNQAAAVLGIGRSTMYTLMYRGDIRPVHIGRCVRIHPQDLEQFVAGLRCNQL